MLMEPPPGLEPGTPSLPWKCSTTELRRHNIFILPDDWLQRITLALLLFTACFSCFSLFYFVWLFSGEC